MTSGLQRLHPIAGGLAFGLIALFWTSTAISELTGSKPLIVAVKTAIPYGFILLIPALAAAGGSGFALAKGRAGGLLAAKKSRMPVIAANGLLVLMPAAFFLAMKARAGEFDAAFYGVQAAELVFGAVNLTLLGLNLRDGFRMTARRRAGPSRAGRA